MIPHNRPVINEADVARRLGVPLATWRRRDAPDFRNHVPTLLPDSRSLVYDQAQSEAYIAGKPIPPLPAGEHPDDLLTDKEVTSVLGINTGTVRAYASQDYLSGGTTVYGTRLWPRHEVNERRDNPPGQGKGGSRRASEPQGPRKSSTPTKATPGCRPPATPSPRRAAHPKATSPPHSPNC
ncbi:DNA-binding protein [Streptomyces sp. NPDC006482]|uniref:DNA-binding protein n=1 Tax=Streptomyces sp. NPDC006482 TaxID=3154306 RepID=UPI0033BC8284